MLAGLAFVMAIPVLIGLGSKWSARTELEQLGTMNKLLQAENESYRGATGAFAAQIQSLEEIVRQMSGKRAVDSVAAKAMQELPVIARARAAGGSTEQGVVGSTGAVGELVSSRGDTFGLLHGLLQILEGRLHDVRLSMERRDALAAAVPSIWPARGWLTGSFGPRRDPFTGEAEFHQGIDISTDEGQDVVATADGTVELASYSGDYGNLVVLQHTFGLTTRYGHLSAFTVTPGRHVKRGDVIGYVGATGRATGPHLHYEILANGSVINPLQLLTAPAAR
jgi:murein DD-endopeptidase MepM/ murein hydrolase activator NlpD